MDTSVFELALAILSGVGGGGAIVVAMAAWLGKLWADRIAQQQKFVGEIDLNLRERRIGVYTALWKSTALLPKWPQNENVTYEDLRLLSQTLRNWYFDTGGIYLSRTAHDQGYGPLQEIIAELTPDDKTGRLSPYDDEYESIRRHCSTLRTLLAADIESRRDSPI